MWQLHLSMYNRTLFPRSGYLKYYTEPPKLDVATVVMSTMKDDFNADEILVTAEEIFMRNLEVIRPSSIMKTKGTTVVEGYLETGIEEMVVEKETVEEEDENVTATDSDEEMESELPAHSGKQVSQDQLHSDFEEDED